MEEREKLTVSEPRARKAGTVRLVCNIQMILGPEGSHEVVALRTQTVPDGTMMVLDWMDVALSLTSESTF